MPFCWWGPVRWQAAHSSPRDVHECNIELGDVIHHCKSNHKASNLLSGICKFTQSKSNRSFHNDFSLTWLLLSFSLMVLPLTYLLIFRHRSPLSQLAALQLLLCGTERFQLHTNCWSAVRKSRSDAQLRDVIKRNWLKYFFFSLRKIKYILDTRIGQCLPLLHQKQHNNAHSLDPSLGSSPSREDKQPGKVGSIVLAYYILRLLHVASLFSAAYSDQHRHQSLYKHTESDCGPGWGGVVFSQERKKLVNVSSHVFA